MVESPKTFSGFNMITIPFMLVEKMHPWKGQFAKMSRLGLPSNVLIASISYKTGAVVLVARAGYTFTHPIFEPRVKKIQDLRTYILDCLLSAKIY